MTKKLGNYFLLTITTFYYFYYPFFYILYNHKVSKFKNERKYHKRKQQLLGSRNYHRFQSNSTKTKNTHIGTYFAIHFAKASAIILNFTKRLIVETTNSYCNVYCHTFCKVSVNQITKNKLGISTEGNNILKTKTY